MLHLLRRRPTFRPALLEAYEKIRTQHIKELQNGSSIITADEPAEEEASLAGVDGPTTTEWKRMNIWRDRIKIFPARIQAEGRNS
jgi:hypothetical protein